MKQTIITIAFAVIFSGLFAAPNTTNEVKDYVVTEKGITYVEKVRNGLNHCLVAITGFGEKLRIDLDEVKAFRRKGKEYTRLYLVESGSTTVKSVLMERLITRAGYTLYKRTIHATDELGLNDFFVYEGDKLVLQLNENNYKVVFSFFYTKMNMMFANEK